MARGYKPEPHTVCVECRQPIGSEEYYYTKKRGYPPTFIHKSCYEKLLPNKDVRNNENRADS